jgi:class 3 adenylate cyclase/tetratricopeptide (TPR) repeat protein
MSANEDPNSSAQGASSNAVEIRSLIEQARSLPRNSRAAAEQSLRRAVDLAASAGLKRLEASARHELGCVLPGTDSGKEEALRELNRALEIHVELGDLRGQCKGLLVLGQGCFSRSDLANAVPYLHEAERLCKLTGDLSDFAVVYGLLAGVYGTAGDGKTALEYATLHFQAATRLGDARELVDALDGLGCSETELGLHDEARRHMEAALAEVPRIGDVEIRTFREAMVLVDLADALCNAENWDDAKRYADRASAISETHRYNGPLAQALYCTARAMLAEGDDAAAENALRRSHSIFDQIGNKNYKSKVERELSKLYRLRGDYLHAFEFLERAASTETAMRGNAAMNQFAQQRAREKLDALRREKDAAERVLFNVLPNSIAKRVVGGAGRIAEDVADASILFADVVGFTELAARIAPGDLLQLLDRIFSKFDALAAEHGLEKIKTIGDAYMVAGGVPEPLADHLERCARLALSMLDAMAEFNRTDGSTLSLRIGLHVGRAVAGVIGSARLTYDLWGETVNFASRLESSGMPGRIHVSLSVRSRLNTSFSFTPRGHVVLKGIGDVETYCLEGPLL